MKNRIIYMAIALILATACQNTGDKREASDDKGETENKAEVKKYYNKGKLVKEVTFRNDVRNGICRNYYDDGRLKRTIWYENGLKEDTARWYYPEGRVYRATPYKENKIHGVQTKYYKTGRVQATIPFKNGLRVQGLREYLPDGRDAENYPTVNHTIRDQSDTEAGVVKVFVQLSNESVNVRFYRGSLIDGTFDPDKCRDITTSSGMGYAELRPDTDQGKGYVDIIALYSTRFRNRKIITKRIKLPYNNLY
ncbi:MAG TPA: hypothetical protein ENH59_02115 [Bacteroidetes bacterium]|nr:hypothetical protein [Bacteroidota bacterium]